MIHLENNSVINKNNIQYRKFITDKGIELAVIEPGFILNKSAMFVWDQIYNGITYEKLLLKIEKYFDSSITDDLESKILKILTDFLGNNLITINHSNLNNLLEDKFDIKTEVDISKDLNTTVITQIDMVLTTKCNFRCRHCFIKNNSDGFTMNFLLWKRIIDKLCNQGLTSVVVTGGEPLLYKELTPILNYINDKKLNIYLLTNGYLIDDNFIEEIRKFNNVIVQVSLDGSNSITQKYQRLIENSFDVVTKNIKKLTDSGIVVNVAMVLNKQNIYDLYNGSMFDLCEKLRVNMLAITPTVINIENAKTNKKMFLDIEEVIKMIEFVKSTVNSNKYGYKIIVSTAPSLVEDNSIKKIKGKRFRCRRGTNSFSVRPNGDVFVCSDFAEVGFSDYILGNILNDNLDDILNKLNKISINKIEMLDKIKGVCSICKELPYCGGACRADAYAMYNDIYGPYSPCQLMYDKGIFPENLIDKFATYRKI